MPYHTDPSHTRAAQMELIAHRRLNTVDGDLAALLANTINAASEDQTEVYYEVAWAAHLALLAGLNPYETMRHRLRSLARCD